MQYHNHEMIFLAGLSFFILTRIYILYKNYSIKKQLKNITQDQSITTSGKIGFYGSGEHVESSLLHRYTDNIDIIPAKSALFGWAKNCYWFPFDIFGLCTWYDLTRTKEDVLINLKKRILSNPNQPLRLYGYSLGGQFLFKLLEWIPKNLPEAQISEIHFINTFHEKDWRHVTLFTYLWNSVRVLWTLNKFLFCVFINRTAMALKIPKAQHMFDNTNLGVSGLVSDDEYKKDMNTLPFAQIISFYFSETFLYILALCCYPLHCVKECLLFPFYKITDYFECSKAAAPHKTLQNTKFFITIAQHDMIPANLSHGYLISRLNKMGITKNIYTKTVAPQYEADGTLRNGHGCTEWFDNGGYTE